jgi:hypothetical protein
MIDDIAFRVLYFPFSSVDHNHSMQPLNVPK